MGVFRVNKNKNYTVMSNVHLRDKALPLKAKGLLSLMLSLPEDWDYSMRGFLILYFLYLRKSGREQSLLHIAAVFVFCYYLFGILTVAGIGYTSTISFSPKISLIPFLGMITGPIDTILNLILFVPLGVFLPFLYKKYHHIKTVALTGFLFSLSVEIVQMFGWGSSDINDLIINTAGACLGYWIYYLLSKALPNNFRKKLQSENVNGTVEVLLFVIYIYMVMVTVQPWVIHDVLNIG